MVYKKAHYFLAVSATFEKRILNHLKDHTDEILAQVEADLEYQSRERDVPRVPLFTEYLSGLEKDIEQSLGDIGLLKNGVEKLTSQFTFDFYHRWLPSLLALARSRRKEN
jgi:hypothetical protein